MLNFMCFFIAKDDDSESKGKKSRENSKSRSPSLSEHSRRPLSARSNKSSRFGDSDSGGEKSNKVFIREGAGSRNSNSSKASPKRSVCGCLIKFF